MRRERTNRRGRGRSAASETLSLRSPSRWSRSSSGTVNEGSVPLELGNPLLLVGRDPFLRVLALEEELLEFPIHRERRLEGQVPAALHRALDPPDGLGRLVRWDELAGVVHDLLPPLLGRRVDDLVDEAHLVGFLEGERATRDHELDRLRLAEHLAEARRAARSRKYPERDFRQADLAVVLTPETQVACH